LPGGHTEARDGMPAARVGEQPVAGEACGERNRAIARAASRV